MVSCRERVEETAATPAGDLQVYCDAVLKAETLPGAPEEDEGERVKTWTRETQLPAFEDVAAAAPDAVKEDVDVQLDDIRGRAETGKGFPSAEVPDAIDRRMAFDHANCDWQTVDATATEYELGGIPKSLKAGATSFELKNTGKEEHNFAVRRIDESVTESFAEILKDEDRFFRDKNIEGVGGFGARHGATSYGIFDLEPGRYGLACFVPVSGKEGAKHHWERGELAEFTVD